MARTIQVSLSTLQEILGWNGAFLLLVIVSFKLFLAGQAAFTCPCNWNVAYATLMFLLPAFSIFTLACFTYFRQDNDSVPWKVLRKFYKKMCACNFYDETTDWDFHADHCIRCKPRKRDWSLVKVALSVVFSQLYPLAWLSISFLQATYYACARVGPEPNGILGYCDFDILDIAVYRKSYTQAANRSMLIGCIVFAVALFLLAVFLIVYGEIANYLRKVDSLFDVSGTQLQITVSAQPNRTSRTADSISKHDQREESGSRVKGGVRETIRDQASGDGGKAIHIGLTDEFTTALQGFFVDRSWGEVNVNCVQENERRQQSGLRDCYVSLRQHLHPRQQITSCESL